MSTRNNKNYPQRLKFTQNIGCFSVDSRFNPSFSNKKSKILYSSKSSLISILNEIKNCQLDHIKESNTKHLLTSLKSSLTSMLKEKKIIQRFFEKENEKIKSKLRRNLFPENSERVEDTEINNTIGNENLYQSEISQLKLLNFQIENEITNTNNMMTRISEIYYNTKKDLFFLIENNESFCKYNYSDASKASEILHEKINSIRKKFIKIVNKKSEQDMVIKDLMMKKNYIKNRIGKKLINNKYIITEDIINEESKEYTNNYSKTINNSNLTINMKINNKNNKSKLRSNDALDKNLYMINQEKFIRKKLIFSKTVSLKLISNIYQMKNNLIKTLNNNSYINKSVNENENKSVLKSFNSSLEVSSSYHKSNYEQPNEMNLNLNENKLIKTNMMGLNENDNIATDNNSVSKSNKNNNQYSFVFNINEKQNDEADFIFTMPQKE